MEKTGPGEARSRGLRITALLPGCSIGISGPPPPQIFSLGAGIYSTHSAPGPASFGREILFKHLGNPGDHSSPGVGPLVGPDQLNRRVNFSARGPDRFFGRGGGWDRGFRLPRRGRPSQRICGRLRGPEGTGDEGAGRIGSDRAKTGWSGGKKLALDRPSLEDCTRLPAPPRCAKNPLPAFDGA